MSICAIGINKICLVYKSRATISGRTKVTGVTWALGVLQWLEYFVTSQSFGSSTYREWLAPSAVDI